MTKTFSDLTVSKKSGHRSNKLILIFWIYNLIDCEIGKSVKISEMPKTVAV